MSQFCRLKRVWKYQTSPRCVIYASAAYQISTSPALRQIKTLHLQRCNQMMPKSQPYSNGGAHSLWWRQYCGKGLPCWGRWIVSGSSSLWSLWCPDLSRRASSWCIPSLMVLLSSRSVGTPRMCLQAGCRQQVLLCGAACWETSSYSVASCIDSSLLPHRFVSYIWEIKVKMVRITENLNLFSI